MHPNMIAEQEREAFAHLRNTAVQAYLERALAGLTDNLVYLTAADDFRVAQGQAQTCRALLALIDPDRFTTSGKRSAAAAPR